ncbi:MFS transporter [Rhodobacterales bacterium HKCCE3408]|nr:MFS transporter [Rhodobacterales bacterium HKCCE3408]
MKIDAPVIAMMGGQVTVWAGLFYSFPALVLDWQAAFGWSSSQVMGAYTLAIAIYALGAPIYGRLIDRGLAPWTLPGGALVGAALLVVLSFVEGIVAFYLVWAAIGICMGLTLYEACFAILTRARGADARSAITGVALVAGFASSIAYPSVAWLADHGGWPVALRVLALVLVVVTVPLLAFGARRLEAEVDGIEAETADTAPPVRLLTDRRYWAVAAGFAMASLSTGIVLSHLLPLMAAQGVPDAMALTAAACIGPAQVVGRIVMMAAGRSVAAVRMAQVGMAMLALGAVLMGGAAALAALAFGFAVAQGAGYGVVGILRAVVTREVLGQRNYGAIAGAVSLPSLLAFAFAPILGAVIADAAGYGPVIALAMAAPLLGAVCLMLLPRT